MASRRSRGEVSADEAREYADRVTALTARDVGIPLLTFIFRRGIAHASGRCGPVERDTAAFRKCSDSVLDPHAGTPSCPSAAGPNASPGISACPPVAEAKTSIKE
jgi:hypothetical protein